MARQRLLRVASLVQQEISLLLRMGRLKDPRIDPLVSITWVTVSNDIKYAKVGVSHFGGPDQMQEAVHALNHAAGHIQGTVGRALHARETPRLTFVADLSIESGFRVSTQLSQLELGPSE